MPEFEETKDLNLSTSKESPSQNKPKSRRSGGFKRNQKSEKPSNMGEIPEISEKRNANKELDVVTNPSKNHKEYKPKSNATFQRKYVPLSQDTLRSIQILEEKISDQKQFKNNSNRKRKYLKKKGLIKTFLNFLINLLGFNKKKRSNFKRRNRPYYSNKNRRNRKNN